jgi:hypothetical protein
MAAPGSSSLRARARATLLALALLAAPGARAAAAGPVQPATAGSTLPPAVKEALERERPPLPLRSFATAAGISGTVEAAAAPELAPAERGAQLTVELGTAQPLVCAVEPERVDAAGALTAPLRRVASQAGLEVLAARVVAVEPVRGSPLLSLEAVYTGTRAGRKSLGLLKVAVLADDAHSLICVHDEPGYSETFRRIVKGLAASLRRDGVADPRAAARWAELQLLTAGGAPFGFTERRVAGTDGGGQVITTYSARLVPRSPREIEATDDASLERADAEGVLLEERTSTAMDGTPSRRLSVFRTEDGTTYRYEGEIGGTKVSGRFPTRTGVATDLLLARRCARAGAAPFAELRLEQYAPAADPTRATELVVRADPARPDWLELRAGDVAAFAQPDPGGWFRRSERQAGAVKLVEERAWYHAAGAP